MGKEAGGGKEARGGKGERANSRMEQEDVPNKESCREHPPFLCGPARPQNRSPKSLQLGSDWTPLPIIAWVFPGLISEGPGAGEQDVIDFRGYKA